MGNKEIKDNKDGVVELQNAGRDLQNQYKSEIKFEEIQGQIHEKDLVNNGPTNISENVPEATVKKTYEYNQIDQDEDYSDWDIITFECLTPCAVSQKADNDGKTTYDHLNDEPIVTQVPAIEPYSRSPDTKGKFPKSPDHTLYTVYEDQAYSDDPTDGTHLYLPRDRTHTRESIESYTSAASTASTVSIGSNIDGSLFDDKLSPTRIQVFMNYNQKSWVLRIGVKQMECSLDPIFENLRVYWQVHMTLLPYKRQKLKTKYRTSPAPLFNQAFEVKGIAKSVLNQLSVRYRVYGRFGRVGRKRLAGEVILDLHSLIKQPGSRIKEWKTLRTSSNASAAQNTQSEVVN